MLHGANEENSGKIAVDPSLDETMKTIADGLRLATHTFVCLFPSVRPRHTSPTVSPACVSLHRCRVKDGTDSDVTVQTSMDVKVSTPHAPLPPPPPALPSSPAPRAPFLPRPPRSLSPPPTPPFSLSFSLAPLITRCLSCPFPLCVASR